MLNIKLWMDAVKLKLNESYNHIRSYNSKIKSSHHKHHKNQEHQEISQSKHMPQTCHHPSAITLRLLQLNAIRIT